MSDLVPVVDVNLGTRTPAEVREWLASVREMLQEVLEPGVDYGWLPKIPKPVLLKPGAEKLALLADLGTETVRVAWEPGPTGEMGATYKTTATRPSGRRVEVERYAGYDESQFLNIDSANGRVRFKATWDNVIAMAQKRAFVAAVKLALGLSGLFADMERGTEEGAKVSDKAPGSGSSDPAPAAAAPAPGPRRPVEQGRRRDDKGWRRDKVPDDVYDNLPEAFQNQGSRFD